MTTTTTQQAYIASGPLASAPASNYDIVVEDAAPVVAFASPGIKLGSTPSAEPIVATAWLVPGQDEDKKPEVTKTAGTRTTTTTTITHYPAPQATAAGYEALRLMSADRRQRRVFVGLVGGVVGFFILGPLGAILIGLGASFLTNSRLLRKEALFKQRLEAGEVVQQPVLPVSKRGRRRRRC